MAHRHDVYKYGRFIEHEFKFVGKFGAKGEQRSEKKKATPVYEEGHFKDLASYLVKEATEEITGQLTLFGTEEEKKIFLKYGCSRNLEMPEKETHKYKRRTVRKLIENGPEPQPGYYIDQDSIRYGVNPYTGMSYYYYTEIRLERDAGEIRRECEDLCGQSVYTPLRP